MARMTVKQVEARLGVSYVVAAGLVSHLAKTGKAVIVEKVFHESGKGKPTRVYEIDENVSLDLTGASEVVVAKATAEAVAEPEAVEADAPATDVSEAA